MATEEKTPSVPVEQVSPKRAEDALNETPETTQAADAAEVSQTPKPTPKPKAAVKKAVKVATTSLAEDDEVEDEIAAVDFSDEEAQLAASAPEFDIEDDNADLEQEEAKAEPSAESANYTGKSKAELVELFADMLENKPVQALRRDAEAVKVAFYKNHKSDVDQLRRMFIEAGGKSEEFVAPVDEYEQRLKELFVIYRAKRNEFISKIESEKENNYKIKLAIIDELKELINSSETLNHTFNAFRELQHRWKETGVVQQIHNKDLWETYNLYVENFYNFIKINKELRDLDLKKNYEAKLQLCEDAEGLVIEPSVINSFHKLQKLHEMWRETGPVANEYKDQLWDRFRDASSKINKRHQEYFENIKDEQKRNFELKSELCTKTEELTTAMLSTRKEWNKASEQLIEIQKIWKTIGFAPKKDNTKVYERFRNACDKFFENKRNFYLQAKSEMENNLNIKNDICAAAEAIKDSEEWKKCTDELIALQKRWKEVGPVSRRYSDSVWKRFRAACDYFFERKAKHFASVDTVYVDNLAKKRELLETLKNFVVEEREKGFEALKEIQRSWSEVGFVPIKYKEEIQAEYRKIVDTIFVKLRGNEKERHLERFKGKISSMVEGGDRRVRHERERLYNKLKTMEADIALLENNIGFFSKSKNAEAMVRDVKDKIAKSKEEMATLLEKINMIDKQGE